MPRSSGYIGIANPRWRGKRSRYSRRMRNPQFYVSGKRPMAWCLFNTSTSDGVDRSVRFRGTEQIRSHEDVIKWKHFPPNWPFVRGIHRSPVDFPSQGSVTRSFGVFFDLHLNKRSWTNGWANNGDAGNLRHYRTYFDVPAMIWNIWVFLWSLYNK